MTTIAEGRLIDRFVEQLMKWPGVQEVTGDNLGERSLRVGGREFLHIHGDSTLHIQLTKEVKAEVLAKGQAEQHPYAPRGGMVAYYLRCDAQLAEALQLSKIALGHAASRKTKPGVALERVFRRERSL